MAEKHDLAAERAILDAFGGSSKARTVDLIRKAGEASDARARKAFWNLVSQGRIALTGSGTVRRVS